jgi:hypothetical protein
MINSLKFKMPKYQTGGIVSNMANRVSQTMKMPDLSGLQRFADGGVVSSVSGAAETLIVRFQAGDVEAPVKITDKGSRMAMKEMAKEMAKMRLIYAR